MIIKEWLLRSGVSQRKLAKGVGVTYMHLCLVINGRVRPSSELALKISEYTKSSVSVEEALFPERFTSIIPIKGKKRAKLAVINTPPTA